MNYDNCDKKDDDDDDDMVRRLCSNTECHLQGGEYPSICNEPWLEREVELSPEIAELAISKMPAMRKRYLSSAFHKEEQVHKESALKESELDRKTWGGALKPTALQ